MKTKEQIQARINKLDKKLSLKLRKEKNYEF